MEHTNAKISVYSTHKYHKRCEAKISWEIALRFVRIVILRFAVWVHTNLKISWSVSCMKSKPQSRTVDTTIRLGQMCTQTSRSSKTSKTSRAFKIPRWLINSPLCIGWNFISHRKDIESCRNFLQPHQTLDIQSEILEHFRRSDDHAQMSEIGYKKRN